MKTWQGRIATTSHPLFESFTSSVEQDKRLAPYDIRVSRAHAAALARAGIISERGAAKITEGLDEIQKEIETGSFAWHDDLEDVHTHVESRLRDKLGHTADTLHAGRSRNDQISADLRLFVKDATLEALAGILDLESALLDLAARQGDAVMPGYTHLQQAQPVLIAHTLAAQAAMLERDWERFSESLARSDRSPLGSGALAGSTFALDRRFLADQCGFSAVIDNSLDAVSDRDFVVEFVAAAALCMTHLSRFAEDLIAWSSVEFSFVRLPDSFASGSSMMPQKKNPDVAELIRGKAALVIGDMVAAITLIKGIPLGYNRDLQEDKTPLFHAVDTLLSSVHILAAMVPALEFDTDRTANAVSSFALATDMADHLVREGMPFREAHAVVGGLVSECLKNNRDLAGLTSQELREASPLFAGLPALSVDASVRRKQTSGSTHPDDVRRHRELRMDDIARRRTWLEERR
ncbi:MAG: argininosuccinate lyase [Chloroflexota bacterium]